MLRKQAVSGAKWTTLGNATSATLQFAQLTVLAWILAREDFGIVSMLMVVLGLAQMLSDLGVGNAIIHRQNPSREELSSLFWMNVIAGGFLCTALVISAPLAAELLSDQRLTPLIRLAAAGFLIVPLGQQAEILLQKDLRFKPLALIDIAAAVLSFVVAVCVAAIGGGASSLVWAYLSATTVRAGALAAVGLHDRRPQLRLRYADVQSYLSFGLYQVGERFLNYASSRVDVVLIGRYLGADALGVYSLAYQFVIMPLARINPILTRVAFPVFVRGHGTDSIRRGYLQLVQLLSIAVFPFLVGLATTSSIVIPVVLGEKWVSSSDLIPALAVVGMAKALANPTGIILLSKGRANVGFWYQVVTLAVNCITFTWTVHNGLHFLTWTYVGVSMVNLIGTLLVLRNYIGLNLRSYLSALKLATSASIAMVSTLLAIRLVWPQSASDIAETASLITVGASVYVLCLYVMDKHYVQTLLAMLRQRAG